MDAKELMIDDWVMIDEPNRYAGGIAQIKSLFFHKEGDGVYFSVFYHGDKGVLMIDVFNEDLRPIPLTEEILNKNGFYFYHINELCSNSNCFNEDEEMKLELSLERSGKIFWTANASEYILMSLDYVHQLQHALRRCGIEKEIKV